MPSEKAWLRNGSPIKEAETSPLRTASSLRVPISLIVSRRIGRGYQVVLLDRCGRAVMTRRAPTRTEAARIAGTMARAAQESA